MSSFLKEFSKTAAKLPDNTAISHVSGNNKVSSVSFSELDRRSDTIATYLLKRGVSIGSVVGLFMHKSIDHVAAILGTLKAGTVFYCLNSRSTLNQVTYTASLARCSTIFIDNETLLTFADINKIRNSGLNLTHFSSTPPAQFHSDILHQLKAALPITQPDLSAGVEVVLPSARTVGQDVAFALFTSGSTGQPKGVLVSHQDLYNRVLTESRDFLLTPDDCLLSLLPFSFDVGANQLFSSLITGAHLVILNSWLPADISRAIRQHNITGISGVPAIWAQFLDETAVPLAEDLKQLRYITVSGGDLTLNQLHRLREVVDRCAIYKTYGQSETFRSSILMPSDFLRKIQSVGRPVSGTEIRILGRNGKTAKPHEVGEIIHHGDGTMLAYLGDPHGTRKKLRSSPFQGDSVPYKQKVIFTGDLGKLDEEGYLYILGRKDKMIKTSGYRVYPQEVADQLLHHDSVKNAVVFGVDVERTGKAIYTEIELKQNRDLTELELRAFLADKLPPYMIPSRFFFVTSFPRTPSGKIRLAEIEKKYRHE